MNHRVISYGDFVGEQWCLLQSVRSRVQKDLYIYVRIINIHPIQIHKTVFHWVLSDTPCFVETLLVCRVMHYNICGHKIS